MNFNRANTQKTIISFGLVLCYKYYVISVIIIAIRIWLILLRYN